LVFGTGKGAGKLILIMALVVGGFFVFRQIQKRTS